MTKDDIIRKVAEEADLTLKKAKLVVDAILAGITEAMVKKEKLTFTGFGTFNVIKKAARKGKNPRTKEIIDIPAKNSTVFRAGKTLKDKIN